MKYILNIIILTTLILTSCNVSRVQENENDSEVSIENSSSIILLEKSNYKLYKINREIEQSISSQNWKKFISYCDSENYKTQKEMGMEDFQYVFEILNIKSISDGNYIEEINTRMKTIVQMKVSNYQKTNSGGYEFTGYIITSDNLKFEISYEIIFKENQYKITGAVG